MTVAELRKKAKGLCLPLLPAGPASIHNLQNDTAKPVNQILNKTKYKLNNQPLK
jgi:hypothetical protein